MAKRIRLNPTIPDVALTIDTETTGTYLYHGCQPFMVTACDTEANLFCWEYPVNPYTREVLYNKSSDTKQATKELTDVILSYRRWVFHNSTFDLRALEIISPSLYSEMMRLVDKGEAIIEDTLIQAHLIDSADSHGLKYLGDLHLSIPTDDEEQLRRCVIEARAEAKKLDLCYAQPGLPSLPNYRGQYELCDYWVPKAVAILLGYDESDLWHNICQEYAERDVERTILLYKKFSEYLDKHITQQRDGYECTYKDVYDAHKRIIHPVLAIQRNGMRFYYNKSEKVVDELYRSIIPFQERINELAGEGFNHNSTKQLREALYDKAKLPVINVTKKGAPSTDAGTLHEYLDDYELKVLEGKNDFTPEYLDGISLIHNILKIRKNQTSISYINNYREYAKPYITKYTDGSIHKLYYLHPSLNPTGTSTTRFSSSNPNGQNISKGEDIEDDSGAKKKAYNLRELFGPPPGYVWYTIDYKSLQLIIFAYESQDEGLIETFLSGGDPHNYVACGLFETNSPTELERRIAKNVNYGLIFGAGQNKIDATAGRKGTFQLYNNQFPGVQEYMQTVIRNARKFGNVTTAWGYPLEVPLDFAYRGVNYIIQGDEGELVKRAMINCHEYLEQHHKGSDCDLIMQIHDELIFQCPEWYNFPLQEIEGLMMKPAADIGWHTPVDTSIVRNHWGAKEDIC